MSKSLLFREIDRGRTASWRQVMGFLEGHTAGSALQAARNIKRKIRRYRNPALIRNGGKP